MKLSTKGHYAVTAMMELAIKEKTAEKLTLKGIAETQHISISYLEQIFACLRKNQLVKGARGRAGGYCLARPASTISIAAIIKAVEEDLDTTINAGRANRSDMLHGKSEQLWSTLSKRLFDFLDVITLEECIYADPQSASLNDGAMLAAGNTSDSQTLSL